MRPLRSLDDYQSYGQLAIAFFLLARHSASKLALCACFVRQLITTLSCARSRSRSAKFEQAQFGSHLITTLRL